MTSAVDKLRQFWDQRYADADYAYGRAPNEFLVSQLAQIRTGGEVLCVADGEGRNSVWLAAQGLHVTAVDISPQGIAKARALAQEQGVALHTEVADLSAYQMGEARWDAVVSIFLHLPPLLRRSFHARCLQALKPGGVFIYEAYGDQQLGLGTGGPKELGLLPQALDVAADFVGGESLHAYDGLREVREGALHSGQGYVLQFVIRNPLP